MKNETMTVIILAALSSGLVSTVLVKIVDFIRDIIIYVIKEKKVKEQKVEQHRLDYSEEKKLVYLEALKNLAVIRTGFDFSRDDLDLPEALKKIVDEVNNNSAELSAKLRLYSSDDIYNVYWYLNQYSKYAYVENMNASGLTEEGKRDFSKKITFLARLMQVDLGYRDYVLNPEKIKCPICKKEHDFYKTCKCGLTWNQTIDALLSPLNNNIEK